MRVAEIRAGAPKDVLKLETPPEKENRLPTLIDAVKRISPERAEIIAGGVTGVISREGVVAKSSANGWHEYDFAKSLKESVSDKVYIYNDALMAGLGEAAYGAGKDKEVVGYIGLGTGIGTARIRGKKIDSYGFEAGHHVVDVSNYESWEEKVSGRVLREKHQKYPQELEREVYDDYVRMIAFGVYNSILFWSPDIVIMGGALINESEGFKVEEIAAAVGEVNEDLPALPPIRRSELGDEAGLYGAMAVIENKLNTG